MRAAYCQDCGTCVPKDTRNCPKCHALHISKAEAKRYDVEHPTNTAVIIWGKKSTRSTFTLRSGEKHHAKPRLPQCCPWCGAMLRWGEDKKRPGTWIGLNSEKVHIPPPRNAPSNYVSGWSFNLLINRDQISPGGAYQEHSCSQKFDKNHFWDTWKSAIYVEALEQ